MTPDELRRHLESLLFVAAEPAEISQLAVALDVTTDQLDAALLELSEQCQTRGLRLQRKGQRVQLASAPESAPFVEKFLGLSATTRLSHAALETLAIIAYRQPITRAAIESLRGVDCDGVVRTLLARQLIQEIDRLDTVGHPVTFGTTFEFLRYFGLQKLDELPPLQIAEPHVQTTTTDAIASDANASFVATAPAQTTLIASDTHTPHSENETLAAA